MLLTFGPQLCELREPDQEVAAKNMLPTLQSESIKWPNLLCLFFSLLQTDQKWSEYWILEWFGMLSCCPSCELWSRHGFATLFAVTSPWVCTAAQPACFCDIPFRFGDMTDDTQLCIILHQCLKCAVSIVPDVAGCHRRNLDRHEESAAQLLQD